MKGDGLVVVWNLKAIKDKEAAEDENVPKSLARIKLEAAVNCVRWSTDGRQLACALDDKSVIIYEYGRYIVDFMKYRFRWAS